MIGIIGATDEEISVIKKNVTITNTILHYNIKFYEGLLNNRKVIITCSGIGKVNAARCTQLLICEYSVTNIINLGTAGSLLEELSMGDIVISNAARYYDYDASGIGIPAGTMLGMKDSVFLADNTLLQTALKCCSTSTDINNYKIGLILTGDQVISHFKKKFELHNLYKGICVEMEGAAIAQTAMMCNIPWIIIRSISDNADSFSKIDFQKAKNIAIDNCSSTL